MSTKCVSYYRTSSVTNTGEDKDSLKRQKYVVHRFCNNNGYKIEDEFYETLRGDGDILSRPKFVVEGELLLSFFAQEMTVRLKKRERIMSICFTWFPNKWFRRT